jgi:hypothetical protein
MIKYRLLKDNEVIRKTDEEGYTVNGKFVWRLVGGHGFKVKDCVHRSKYRRML